MGGAEARANMVPASRAVPPPMAGSNAAYVEAGPSLPRVSPSWLAAQPKRAQEVGAGGSPVGHPSVRVPLDLDHGGDGDTD